MSLRLRLFLILGALVAALVGAHGWLVRSLAGELTAELDVVALDVGASVARVLSAAPAPPAGSPPAVAPPAEAVRVLRLSREEAEAKGLLAPGGEPGAAPDAGAANEKNTEKRGERIVVRHLVRRSTGDPLPPGEPGRPPGFAYYFETKSGQSEGPPGGEPELEKLILRLGDGAKGALQVRGADFSAEVPIPRVGLQEKLDRFQRNTLIGSLALLLAGLLAAAYLAHRVSSPLQRLASAAAVVGDGAWGTTVDERAGASELRQALGAFNRMSARLRELSQQNQRLTQERHLGEIGEIARGLAHSLRNPLHALGLTVDEIAAGAAAGAEEGSALAAAARRQIGRLDRSIRSFLVFASQGDALRHPVDLGALAEDVALEALQDPGRGVRIEVVRESGEPDGFGIAAVEQELRAMVQALVVNAIEASPPGERVEVRVGRMAESEGRLWLEVADRGPGVAPEIRDRLFTPHLTTKASGSGMGLFLAQRLAASRYEGSLELLPRDGGGTRARLELAPRTLAGEP